MPKNIYVVGHKNPDTDSICAALAYAELKKELGLGNAVACRAGKMNRETKYVLEYFKICEPTYLPDLHIRVKDLLNDMPVVARPELAMLDAWKLMRENGVKTLSVVDAEGHLLGIITVGDIAEKCMEEIAREGKGDNSIQVNTVLVPIGNVMHKTQDLVIFEEEDLIDDVKKIMLETRFRNYPVVDQNNKVVGSIARYHVLGFSRKQVILVDHNEFGQSVDGIEGAQILEVVDHHRVGGIQTGEPILFRNEPVGSTCTLIARAYFENGITPTAQMAGIMCAAILSDTIVFKSPTCTLHDRNMAKRLAGIAGIDPEKFGIEMFKNTSSLDGLKPLDMLNSDFKEFSIADIHMGIGQINVMGFDGLRNITAELLAVMEEVRKEKGYHYVLLMVTNLLDEATELLISGDKPELIGEAFAVECRENSAFLPGVLSRKKQIIPPLNKFFIQ